MSNLAVTEDIMAPGFGAIETMSGLRDWEKLGEGSNVARVPLAKRTNESVLAIPTMVGFDCGEFAYDPWFTAWSQGAQGTGANGNRTAANVYNFSFWQYVDVSYYFTHRLLTIPPTVWTNACHKNGVLSLGTLNLNVSENQGKFNDADVIAFLTPKPENPDPSKIYLEEAIATLINVAKYFGFDGWLLNVEKSYPSVVSGMLTILSTLKNAGCYTAWYDSPFSTGNGYDNCLTDKGWPFLAAANSFQSNYNWDALGPTPKVSWDTIVRNDPGNKLKERNDVFMSKYCSKAEQGTPPYTDGRFFGSYDLIQVSNPPQPNDPPQYYTGLGVYYPAWDMYDMRANNTGKNTDKLPERDIFHHNDQAFWTGTKDSIIYPDKTKPINFDQCMRNYIEERSVIATLPFVTYFNDGEGDYYNFEGVTLSTGPWNNLSDQSVLPTYRFFLNYDRMRKNNTAIAHPDDPNSVFSGGSCLSMDFDGQNALSFDLFKMKLTLPQKSQLSLVRKQTNVKFEFAVLSFSDNSSAILNSPKVSDLKNGWQKVIFDLPPDLSGMVVTKLGFQLLKAAPGDATYYFGQLSFIDTDGDSLPPRVVSFSGDSQVLDWKQDYSPSSHYLVYGELNGQYHLIGVVYNSVYRVSYGNGPSTNIFNTNLSGFTAYRVCEVTASGQSKTP